MKKRLAALAMAATMVMSLAACSSKPAETAAPTTAAPAATEAPKETEAPAAPAADYPTKAIKDIVPTSAGGSTDIVNRMIGSTIEKYIGQPFVVENVTGGAQVIGVTAIKDAAPDGYTIGVGWGASFGMRPYLLEVTYEQSDFQTICGVLEQKNCIVVRADAPWETIEDLFADMKENDLLYGAGSAASYQYMWASYLMSQAEDELHCTMVPHDGDSGALTSLQQGAVDWVCCETTSAVSGLSSGDLRLLVSLADERDSKYPDVPCITEYGYEANLKHTLALVTQAAVDPAQVEVLRAGIEESLKDPDFMAQAEQAGYNIVYKDAAECEAEVEAMKEIIEPMIEAGVFQ